MHGANGTHSGVDGTLLIGNAGHGYWITQPLIMYRFLGVGTVHYESFCLLFDLKHKWIIGQINSQLR